MKKHLIIGALLSIIPSNILGNYGQTQNTPFARQKKGKTRRFPIPR